MILDLYKSTATMLRIGVYIGLAIIVVGLAMSMLGMGDTVLYAGILVLILSPFLGIIVSFLALVTEKDWIWAGVAGILLVITVSGIILAI